MSDKLLAISLRTPQEQIAALIRERDKFHEQIQFLSSECDTLKRERDAALASAEKANARWLEMVNVVAETRAKAIEEAAAVVKSEQEKRVSKWYANDSQSVALVTCLDIRKGLEALREKP
jgi:uncharacterized coiled-coil DUF342 family protein